MTEPSSVYIAIAMACFIVAVWFVGPLFPFYRDTIMKKQMDGKFLPSLEGLRGLLALFVFLHHAGFLRSYYYLGKWNLAQPVFRALGPFAVTLFFLLSGYVFWAKMLKCEGRLELKPYFAARVLRVMPAYALSTAIVIFFCFAVAEWKLLVPMHTLWSGIAQWFMFGYPRGAFVPLNDFSNAWMITCGVGWTLRHEMVFYLVLPLFGWFARERRWPLLPLLFFYLWYPLAWRVTNGRPLDFDTWTMLDSVEMAAAQFFYFCMAGFGLGMIAASIRRRYEWKFLRHWSFGLFVIAASAAYLAQGRDYFAPTLAIPLFFIFIPLAFGNDVFGLLSSKPVLWLGTVSYSVYIFHGTVLFLSLGLIKKLGGIHALSTLFYEESVIAIGLVLLAICSFTYRYVEYPFMKMRLFAAKRRVESHAAVRQR